MQFSGKNRLYGFKCELSDTLSGYRIDFTKHYAGSVANVEILYRNNRLFKIATKKVGSVASGTDGEIWPDHKMQRREAGGHDL